MKPTKEGVCVAEKRATISVRRKGREDVVRQSPRREKIRKASDCLQNVDSRVQAQRKKANSTIPIYAVVNCMPTKKASTPPS